LNETMGYLLSKRITRGAKDEKKEALRPGKTDLQKIRPSGKKKKKKKKRKKKERNKTQKKKKKPQKKKKKKQQKKKKKKKKKLKLWTGSRKIGFRRDLGGGGERRLRTMPTHRINTKSISKYKCWGRLKLALKTSAKKHPRV